MHQTPGYPVSENINNWKTQINTNPSIVGDFNIPLFPMYRLPGQNKNRKTSEELNRYLQHILSKHQRIHILASRTQTLSKSRPHTVTQTNAYIFLKTEITAYSLSYQSAIISKLTAKQNKNKHL